MERGGKTILPRWIGYCFLASTASWAQATTIAAGEAPTPQAVGAAQQIDDSEFESALPPLNASPAPDQPPSAPALAAGTTATGTDPLKTGNDEELNRPLAPLSAFDPVPIPPSPVESAKGASAKELRYQVRLEGFSQVELEEPFRGLSALLHDGKMAANAAQIRARADEDVKLAIRLLHAQGYYDGTASVEIPASITPDTVVPVTLTVSPGQRYRLGTIAVTGLSPAPHDLALSALDLHSRDPIAAQPIEDAEARVSLRLPEQGYPFVKVGDRDIALDPATGLGDYTLPVEPGPLARFGKLRAEGDPVFDLRHLEVFPRFKSGEIYDSRRTDDLRQALIATGLLSTASVEPVRTGAVRPDGTETVDLLIRQVRGKARTLSASAGYGTGEGLKLTGDWANNNLFPPEGALIFDATAGTQQQSVGATFRRSNAGLRDRTFQASASVSRQRFEAYDAQSVTLAASISRQSTPIWQKRWTYSIGAELTATREDPFDPLDASHPHSTYFLAALPGQIGYDRSDSLLDPKRGFRLSLRVTPTAQKQKSGGFEKYATMLGEGSGYWPVGSDIVLAGRARLGSIVGAARDAIAPSRRLYSGGGGSVRGFGYQQLGPKDADQNPIGGRSLTEFAVEARYRFGNYGIVPFMDAGRVGAKASPSLSGMRYGVGIGARYYTNFGPFRIDVATPLRRHKGESKLGVYISIGQAF